VSGRQAILHHAVLRQIRGQIIRENSITIKFLKYRRFFLNVSAPLP